MRAIERFGAVPKIAEIVKGIQQGKYEFIKRTSLRLTLWKVQIAGKDAVAVYDRQRKMIVTFLPYTDKGEKDVSLDNNSSNTSA